MFKLPAFLGTKSKACSKLEINELIYQVSHIWISHLSRDQSLQQAWSKSIDSSGLLHLNFPPFSGSKPRNKLEINEVVYQVSHIWISRLSRLWKAAIVLSRLSRPRRCKKKLPHFSLAWLAWDRKAVHSFRKRTLLLSFSFPLFSSFLGLSIKYSKLRSSFATFIFVRKHLLKKVAAAGMLETE